MRFVAWAFLDRFLKGTQLQKIAAAPGMRYVPVSDYFWLSFGTHFWDACVPNEPKVGHAGSRGHRFRALGHLPCIADRGHARRVLLDSSLPPALDIIPHSVRGIHIEASIMMWGSSLKRHNSSPYSMAQSVITGRSMIFLLLGTVI